MGRKIEVKAKVGDMEELRKRVEKISDGPGEEIGQEDVFFYSNRGRMKLRILAADQGELIYYARDDKSGPRVSNYTIYETANPAGLREVVGQAAGVRGIVRKRRWLYWLGKTRIHLDQVNGLGSFLELEVVFGTEEDHESAKATAAAIMNMLDIDGADLIEGAYIDLLEENGEFGLENKRSSK